MDSHWRHVGATFIASQISKKHGKSMALFLENSAMLFTMPFT